MHAPAPHTAIPPCDEAGLAHLAGRDILGQYKQIPRVHIMLAFNVIVRNSELFVINVLVRQFDYSQHNCG